MRKTLEAISMGALAVLIWSTYRALTGPIRLPARIPTHFNLAGQPDSWGTPAMLLLLPALGVGLYLLMTLGL
jgi:uncharacterized membrane protein